MNELENLIHTYHEAKSKDRSLVLATVVHVEGSSYRRAGARMLVDEDGMMTGAISGGCLEGDALRKALHALHQRQNKLVTYDTSDEDDAVIGAQLGCNGIIQVLFEPIDYNNDNNPFEVLKKSLSNASCFITFFNLDKSKDQLGASCWVDENQVLRGEFNPDWEVQLNVDIKTALAENTSLFREYQLDNQVQYVFIEKVKKPIHLVVVGAGNDAQVLSRMANLLGWKVTITDGRPTHANKDRFHSGCLVIVTKPEETLKHININEQTVFVLMTHNYKYDLSVLRLLVEKEELKYIGILGPKKKFDRMISELDDSNIQLSNEQLSKIYAPVGLSLGAETPSEISLSILAEIQAVMTNSSGDFLRETSGSIHQKKNNQFKKITINA